MAPGEPQAENPHNDLDLTDLDRALQRMYRTRALIGTMPPAPGTARGRAGGLLVQFVRRALFWLFPQLDGFHGATVAFAECQMALMEEMRLHLVNLDETLARIQSQALLPSDHVSGSNTSVAPEGELWLQLVRCQAGIESVRQRLDQAPD
jgi:hypothetical protein